MQFPSMAASSNGAHKVRQTLQEAKKNSLSELVCSQHQLLHYQQTQLHRTHLLSLHFLLSSYNKKK